MILCIYSVRSFSLMGLDADADADANDDDDDAKLEHSSSRHPQPCR